MPIGGQNSTWKHGTNGAISTNTDFSAKTRSVQPSFDAEQVDSTTFGDGYRDFEQSFKNGAIEATYKYDTTIFGQLSAIYNGGDVVTFELGPDGATAPKPKVTGSMFITKLGFPIEIGNLLEFSVSWQTSGAVTFGVFS